MMRHATHEKSSKDRWETFSTLFSELENGHLHLQQRLNHLSEGRSELEGILVREIEDFESWRYPLMDQLGRITADIESEEKLNYLLHIRQSNYFNIVQEAPFYWQIINKPNGYAGDAYMMRFIYDDRFEGETPFGMFLHKHAVETKACRSVRNRREFLKEQILNLTGGKVMSLAAGPAQEIIDVLNTCRDKCYKFIALDHDMDVLMKFNYKVQPPHEFKYALANAFHFISGNYQTARPRRAMLKYCYPRMDFKGIRRFISTIKYDLEPLKGGTFDLVYTAGLYDYIKTYLLDKSKGTIALTRNLFHLVKPGGTLIIGNFSENNPRDLQFVMEYIYDWKLIYRNKHEMLDFARDIPEWAIRNIQVIEEPLGINYFLRIDKN